MHVLGMAGLISMALGVVALLGTVAMKLGLGVDMTGNPLLLLSALLELIGAQMISTGLLGEVMTRTYFESQGKRSYKVRTTLNLKPLRRRRGRAMAGRAALVPQGYTTVLADAERCPGDAAVG
jgi:hypothetical protein